MTTAPKPPRRERVDALLVERGLAPTRTKAQALVLAGRVFSGEARVEKAGLAMPRDVDLRVSEGPRFCSRGGDKLDGALEAFAAAGLVVEGRVCVDIGASTGGFTDCLLQRGATRVYAVDVGHGLLDPKLRADPRVAVRERTNARDLAPASFDPRPTLAVVDASFISLGILVGPIARVLAPGGDLVALVKPQFEAGREAVSKGRGVIRDDAVRGAAVARAREAAIAAGFRVRAEIDSAVHGPKGNRERFVWAALGDGL